MKITKYRIKITIFENGRKSYEPQVKKTTGWKSLNHKGEIVYYDIELENRSDALNNIDNHFNGNTKVYTITFEYLTKSKI